MAETLGFIGLGIMGQPMALNLIKAGHQVVVHNRTREKEEPLAAVGAKRAATPAEVGRQAQVVFTMLANPHAVEYTAIGPNGLLESMLDWESALWVDCSTVDPGFALSMAWEAAKRGVNHLDAPVMGSRSPAQQGKLNFLVGGGVESLAWSTPLLQAMGQSILHVGPHGMGSALKMVMNSLLAQSMAALGEALALGEGMGLSRAFLLEHLLDGPFVPPYVATKKDKLVSNAFPADFPLKWMHKDLHLATRAAYQFGVPQPLLNAAKELYAQSCQQGRGELDFSAMAGKKQ